MNKDNQYLLTVVIPTKNRQEYAIQAIKQVLDATSTETQIVVQDNSDQNSLFDSIQELNSTRIKYNYTNELLSFVDNFERAVDLADGDYVTLIGDDDGVLPSIVPICKWAKEKHIETVTSKILVTYYWPNSGAKNYKCTDELGYIRVNDFSSKIKNTNNIDILRKVLRNGCQFYHSSGLPKIYHGLVSKEILDKIKSKHNRLFLGLSPDIYSSFAISMYAKKSCIVDYPFTIDGNCKKSGAGAQAQGKHVGKLKDAPHFQGNSNYKWESLVPYVYSVHTIWADSGLHAIREMDSNNLIEEFSSEMITAYTIANNKPIRKDTFEEYLRIKNIGKISGIIYLIPAFIKGPIPNLLKRIFMRLKGFGQTGKIINNVPNIAVAEELTIKELKNRGDLKYE